MEYLKSLDMVKYFYLAFAALFFSCISRKEGDSVGEEQSAICLTWELTNPELRNQIVEFNNTAEPIELKNKLLVTHCSEEDGFDYYSLYYMMGAYSLQNTSIRFLTEVNGILVAVDYESFGDFQLSEQSRIEIMKRVFPRGYEYYLKQLELNKTDPFAAKYSTEESFYPPPVTGDSECWELKFKDGEMIEKKVRGK